MAPMRRPAAAAKSVLRRPAQRCASYPKEQCPGRSEADSCKFSTVNIGEKARIQPARGQTRCCFCDADLLQKHLRTAQGKGTISAALDFFKEHDEGIYDEACNNIKALVDQEALDQCLRRLAQLQKKGPTKAARARNAQQKREQREAAARVSKSEQWSASLARRVAQGQPTDAERAQHERDEAASVRRLARKLPALYQEDHRRPTAEWRSRLAEGFSKWARYDSWSMCSECHRLQRHKFWPTHVRRPDRKAAPSKCKYCQKGIGYWAPRPEEVPEPLRSLPDAVLEALTMFDIYTGPGERAQGGYWAHTAPIRFSWKAASVERRLEALRGKSNRKKGRKAYRYLTDKDSGSSYGEFLASHERFLGQRWRKIVDGEVDAADPIPWLPMNFIETVGLECAAWPHLYWCMEMCETYVRSQDTRRRTRAGGGSQRVVRGDSSEEEAEFEENAQDGEQSWRQSFKSSFLAKVFSGVIGYGADWKLAQFVYDLWLWSSLGGAKHCAGASLRGALAGRNFSPVYWHNAHAALVDLVKQIGLPALFITVSPFEPSAPCHVWLEDELKKMLRTRTNLPAAETFHLAHLLTQVAEGLICGTNKRNLQAKHRCWREHVLAAADGGQTETVVEIFGRLEFQDGKRQRHVREPQNYHGSGRAHLHLLVWMKNMSAVDWSNILRADLAEDEPEMRDLVEDSQLDYDSSAWALRADPTTFDKASSRILLHHPHNAKAAHVRAFLSDVIAAMQCHMDVLTGDGRALLLQYVASYAAKFSDSFATTWLNEEASAYHLARRILSEYHPLEPEMWLQLGAQFFRQVIATPVMRRLSVRCPWTGPPGEWEKRYMECEWREDDCTLLEYMRLSNKDGRQRSKLRGGGRRRVAVAAQLHSRLKDSFYGQWLLLNVPFRQVDELWDNRVLRVPEGYRMLALCLLRRPGLWRRPLEVQRELQLEGYRDAHVRNILAMLEAHTAVVDAYFSGALNVEDDPVPIPGLFAAPELGFRGALDPEQVTVVDNVREMVKWAVQRRYPDEATAEDLRNFTETHSESAPRTGRPLCILGPAGSGKSTCVEVAIRRAVEAGAHVGVACPTGVLASSYREKFPDLDVDTLHGMFLLHKPENETWDAMTFFDLVVIDEVGQLSKSTFERLLRLWDNAERRPALVLVGDFHQLRGMDSTRALDSLRWRSQVVVRHLKTMRRCKCSELRWKLELLRTAKPSRQQLLNLIRGHRAMPDRPGVSPDPTVLDMRDMLAETPKSTFVTITRRNAALLNELAIDALFGESEPVCIVPGDPESNVDNYGPGGKLIDCHPAQIPVHIGMRVTLTRNVNKELHFVNGMTAEVVDVQQHCVVVRTRVGNIVTVFPYTDDEFEVNGEQCRVTYLPLRLGYAVTLQKVQGATLDHVTIWLDVANVEAAGYVALSRVQRDADWRFIGHVTPHHFTPARGV